MAEVFLAEREGPHGFAKRVALKRILPQLSGDPRLVAMFCDEARIQAALSHPNLVQVFDFGEDAGQPFMVLEHVEGLSGAQLLARLAVRKRSVDLGPALYVARETLEALAYVHDARDEAGSPLGIVHRDVAPGNILIGKQGQVKLGDFGIVRSVAIDSRTVPGELKGKVGYVSPEQALGLPLDHRSDLFSLGVVLAELLIGRPLFDGTTELEILEALHRGDLTGLDAGARPIPSDVRVILERALARYPNRRFQSAQEFSHAVDVAARAHGETLDAHSFAEWLADAGLIAVKSEVRPKSAPSRAAIDELLARSRRLSDPPFSESVTLAADEADAPAESLADALLLVLPERDSRSVPAELAHAVSKPEIVVVDAPRYRLRGESGMALGPVPLSRLLELLATGRVEQDVTVSRDDGPFVPVGSVVELSRLCSRAPYRFRDPVSASERHPAVLSVLPWLLYSVVEQQRTGLLVASRPGEQVRIYFERGAPTFSSSSDARDLLGSHLVRTTHLGAGRLDRVLEEGWRRGQRVGEALLRSGLVSSHDLETALRAQLEGRLRSLLGFREGEVAFADGVSAGESAVEVDDPVALSTRALRAAVTDQELELLLSPLLRQGALEATASMTRLLALLALPEALRAVLVAAKSRVSMAELSLAFGGEPARIAVLVGLASGALVWTA